MKHKPGTPLAERMRPQTLTDYIGQEQLIGPDGVLRKALNTGTLPSMILWGAPGSGKTTLARILATELKTPFFLLTAINSGVKEVRDVIRQAEDNNLFSGARPILFIDEIHRFSKSQQDSLLGAVESGTVTLIGATTENPSFEVVSALLSRCQVYTLHPLGAKELMALAERALSTDERMKASKLKIAEQDALLRLSGGDARKMYNILELAANEPDEKERLITNKKVMQLVQQNMALYDKSGEQHYDIISAFIKSIRGSDPNAAVYWLARMTAGGEDPKFIARRMLILASEDIGNANPTALVLANNCFQAVNATGYPECELILSQTAIYLASSAKSNATYKALKKARSLVKNTGDLPVPLHLRNAPTNLMKELGYGKDYRYAHDEKRNFAEQEYLPEELKGEQFYDPGNNKREEEIRRRLKGLWGDKYGY